MKKIGCQVLLLVIATVWGTVLTGQLAWGQALTDHCTECGGYWVVSTYTMPQEPGCCPQHANFSVYYKPVTGPMRPSTMGEMKANLDPEAPTCIFAHGSFVSVDSALNEARFTYSWLRRSKPCSALNAIFFVWPSADANALLASAAVIENGYLADHNGIYMSKLIDCLPAESPLCLMGHSHGTRLISSALHYRGGGDVLGCRRGCCDGSREIRAVFAAAAINHEWLNPDQKFGRALSQVQCLLLLVNRKDIALTVYPLVGGGFGRAWSKTGKTIANRYQLGSDLCKVQQFDLTFDVGFRHAWEMYYSNFELARSLAPYIHPPRRCYPNADPETLTTTPPPYEEIQDVDLLPDIPAPAQFDLPATEPVAKPYIEPHVTAKFPIPDAPPQRVK